MEKYTVRYITVIDSFEIVLTDRGMTKTSLISADKVAVSSEHWSKNLVNFFQEAKDKPGEAVEAVYVSEN